MSWKSAQEFVGGWLQPINFEFGGQECMLCVDEEGLLKAPQKRFVFYGRVLTGNAVAFGCDGEELADLKMGVDALRTRVNFAPAVD